MLEGTVRKVRKDPMHVADSLYIGGAWRAPKNPVPLDVENPATARVIATVAGAGADDVDAAVSAATSAFDDWAHSSAGERLACLERLYRELTRRQDRFAETITAELGAPTRIASKVHFGLPAAVAKSFLRLLPVFPFEEQLGTSLVVREAAGVVAAITPWNYPLHQVIAKVVPALAAGCTVVLKPAELTPLTALLLAEAVHEADLPPGVFNLLVGTGAEVGSALVRHPGIDMVSFTGSTQVGREIARTAGQDIKRVALELGGKSASVVLPDGDLAAAVTATVSSVMLNTGQSCTALSRLVVPRERYGEALELAAAAVASYPPGDPTAEHTRLGPLVSGPQRRRVLGYIEAGIAEGARLVAGGPEPVSDLGAGHYVRPTVFADVTPGMRIAREEIFGPVLSVLSYHDTAQALQIANDSDYGLSGAVWSRDPESATAFARRMRTGQVEVNGGSFNPLAPFGGFRRSGTGRELGRAGLEEFTELKAVQR
jgi:aldehyde dehydrogenase (NAD+)